MNATDYMCLTRKTAIYGKHMKTHQEKMLYCTLGLFGEVGEIAEKFKKKIRTGGNLEEFVHDEDIAKELGDVAWYWARLCDMVGFDASIVLEMNVAKLQDRLKRGVVEGSGDNR